MTELVFELKKRFDIIYNKSDDCNYNDREVNDLAEIKKLVEKYINKNTVKDTILNLLIFIDAYDNEYIYMFLLDYKYKFTNMIVLLNFFLDFSDHLVNLRSLSLFIEILFNPEISQYFGKEIIINDSDIDSILIENNKNILVTDDLINIEYILFHIKSILKRNYYFFKNINWDEIILKYEEIINKYYKTKSKKFIKCLKYKEILETYRETNYKINYPIFKVDFIKYKKDFDDNLALCDEIYDKTTNKIISTKAGTILNDTI